MGTWEVEERVKGTRVGPTLVARAWGWVSVVIYSLGMRAIQRKKMLSEAVVVEPRVFGAAGPGFKS